MAQRRERPAKASPRPKTKPRSFSGRGPGGLPTRDDILAFVRGSQETVGKREIARAFSIKGGDRIHLKQLLAEMIDEGLIAGGRKEMREKGGMPPVGAFEVIARDDDGELIAEPLVWDAGDGERPRVRIVGGTTSGTALDAPLGVGDRFIGRARRIDEPDDDIVFEAEPVKRLPREQRRLLGIFRARSTGKGGGGVIASVDRKDLRDWHVQPGDDGNAKDGELVRFELIRKGRTGHALPRIVEALGNPADQRKISLIAIHAHGIPDDFPETVVKDAEALVPATLAGRRDLTKLPLITIDPADARDHDDAVHAAPDPDPRNPGGHIVTVAIADVAHYVTPGSRLDREAALRGNSVYFPDRVVPMLPEAISNDLCSLKEGQPRACLVVEMVFNRDGAKRHHTFTRAMMRSAAKLSYEQAQAAIDGRTDDKTAPLLEPILRPLWHAYAALARARDDRSPLDLDIRERRIKLDADGRVAGVLRPERLDAHRLIEEMMIQANVAAAETLEEQRTPCVYRVHDKPSAEKLKALRDFLETLGLKLPQASALKPVQINAILVKAKDLPVPELISEVVLRSQAQAEYAIQNYGHFGLHLSRYAHFTSPIRRYADLLVHRGLIRALKMGTDGLSDEELPGLSERARMISEAERRAMAAERETTDRLVSAHLADRIGARFQARISGVTRSGLFVRLAETGADGFIAISTLGNDFYNHVEAAHALVASRSGETYQLGDDVEVKLVEAIPSAGALRFEMISPGKRSGVSPALRKAAYGKRMRNRRPGAGRR